jgi:hypothetical protein
MLTGGQIWSSVISLDAQPSLFTHGATLVYISWLVAATDRLFLFFFSFFLLTTKVHNCPLIVCCLLESDMTAKPYPFTL